MNKFVETLSTGGPIEKIDIDDYPRQRIKKYCLNNSIKRPSFLYNWMMVFFIWLNLIIATSWAARNTGLCDLINIPNCEGITKQSRRASAHSLPSPSTAANLNPANVSHDKGLGVEAVYQDYNPIALSLVTGTGKIGAAFISSNLENSFFGNRVPELPPEELERREDKQRYQSKKLNFGLGFSLLNKSNYGMDVGLIFKRHNKIGTINSGAGLSGRLGPLNFGASIYQDDFYLKFDNRVDPELGIPYRLEYGDTSYQEKFTVRNYSVGLKIKKLFLDFATIQTRYQFEQNNASYANLYSAGYVWGKFMLNIASRYDLAQFWKYDKVNNEMVRKNKSTEVYGGIQYSVNRFIILGGQYNYFLMKEVSFTGTLFF